MPAILDHARAAVPSPVVGEQREDEGRGTGAGEM